MLTAVLYLHNRGANHCGIADTNEQGMAILAEKTLLAIGFTRKN
jgi:hypothetical protein